MVNACVFDIEANGFLYEVTKLHCVVLYDLEDQTIHAYHDSMGIYPKHGSLQDGLETLGNCECIVGHNICGYDVPAIDKLHPDVDIYSPILVDTQKMAELLFPDIKKQSIENWINILNLPDPKIQIKDWSVLTQQILDRCIGDVKNNVAIYKYLRSEKRKEEADGRASFNDALRIEQEVSLIHSKQVMHGVWFDVDLAIETVDKFTKRMDELQKIVQELAPPVMNIPALSQEKQKEIQLKSKEDGFKGHLPGVNPFKNLKFTKGDIIIPFVKAGGYNRQTVNLFGKKTHTVKGSYCRVTFDVEEIYTVNTINYFGDSVRNVKGPFNKVEFSPLNCSSDTQVKDFLLSIGWIPIEYNYSKKTKERTSPKLTEESYISLPEGLGQDIAEYRVIQHRRSLITNDNDPENKGALSKVRDDHRVPAEAFTCGTPTARYRHSGAVNF